VEDDLKKATEIAKMLVMKCGASKKVGHVHLKKTNKIVEEEVHRLVEVGDLNLK